MKSLILLLTIFISIAALGSTNSAETLEDELSEAVQNDDSVAIQRLTKDPLLVESIYAIRIQAIAYDEGAFGFNVDKNLALELYLKAKSMGDSISALRAGLLYHQEGNSFHDPDQGNQLIVEAASMGNETAQRVAAMCYLDSDCHNSLNFDEMDGWFSDDSVYFHPKANATLKAALSLPAMKNKLHYSYSILSSYSERFEEDEGYDGTYSYFPASLANNISFEQFEYWLEIGIAEKHAQAALSLSALCYLETGICSDKIRAKSLGELAVSWSPDLLSDMGMFVDMLQPDSSLNLLYQAFGVQLTKAIGGDLESALHLYYAFKKGVPNLSIAPNAELANEWYLMVEKVQPSAIFEKYIMKERIISLTSDRTHFLAGNATDSQISETLFNIALEKEYPDALMVSAMKYIGEKQYEKAIPLVKRASSKNDPNANFLLSIMYEDGNGVDQDMRESFRFAEKAAYQGHFRAQFFLAVKYAFGKGSTQDYYKAYAWSNLAASAIDGAIELRDDIAEILTDEQVHQARMISSEIQVKIDNLKKNI